MNCNRYMFEQVVVGYDTYMQTEEVFETPPDRGGR